MRDVWPLFIGQFNKFKADDWSLAIALDSGSEFFDTSLPVSYYNNSDSYTDRLLGVLKDFKHRGVIDDTILFIHEDMILLGYPLYSDVSKMLSYVECGFANSIKMAFAGENPVQSSFDRTVVSNEYSKFSIQPTIVSVDFLIDMCEKNCTLSIWEFESAITNSGKEFSVWYGSESKRGIHHFDSPIFPYIATAIVKGKWNMVEYQDEILELSKEYNIDLDVRGCVR